MTAAPKGGCDLCRGEWRAWSSHPTYNLLVARDASTGLSLYRCAACASWWEYDVLTDRPHWRTDDEASRVFAEIEAGK